MKFEDAPDYSPVRSVNPLRAKEMELRKEPNNKIQSMQSTVRAEVSNGDIREQNKQNERSYSAGRVGLGHSIGHSIGSAKVKVKGASGAGHRAVEPSGRRCQATTVLMLLFLLCLCAFLQYPRCFYKDASADTRYSRC